MENKQTAVEWLAKELEGYGDPASCKITWKEFDSLIEQAKQMEEAQIKDAIMYSLDEDGHTGEWKIKFADNYIKKLKNG